jgi:hypothetical protein
MSEIKVNSVVNSTGDNDSGLDLSTNDQVIIKTANTTAVTVDANQNVAIGVTSKNSANNGSLTIGHTGMTKISASASGNADELILIGADASANVGMSIIANNSNQSNIFFGDEDDTDIGGITYDHSDNSMRLHTNAGEHFRVRSTGFFRASDNISATASRLNSTNAHVLHSNSSGNIMSFIENSSADPRGMMFDFSQASPDNNTNFFMKFEDGTAERAFIYSDGDMYNHDGTFAQISDERIKDNITDANSQWADIKAMRFVNYQRKDDIRQYGKDKAKVQLGLLSQELEKVSPNLVREVEPNIGDIISSSEFGTLYEDGDTIPEGSQIGDVKEVKDKVKGVAYSILYMKSVKALQEAMARIETLEAKVKALESK